MSQQTLRDVEEWLCADPTLPALPKRPSSCGDVHELRLRGEWPSVTAQLEFINGLISVRIEREKKEERVNVDPTGKDSKSLLKLTVCKSV